MAEAKTSAVRDEDLDRGSESPRIHEERLDTSPASSAHADLASCEPPTFPPPPVANAGTSKSGAGLGNIQGWSDGAPPRGGGSSNELGSPP